MVIGGRHSIGNMTTNKKSMSVVGGASGKALDHGGMCVGGVLPLFGAAN
jgi:hypothetical protein